MTLIVSAASEKCVVQVADRRLTLPDGSLYNDFAIKMICVTCQNAVFSMAYTGLAIVNNVRVDKILVDYLTSSHAGRLPLYDVLCLLQKFLSGTFGKLTSLGKRRGITIAMAGFNSEGPFFAWLSNIEDEKGNWLPDIDDNFRVGYLHWNKEPLKKLAVVIHGAEQASDVVSLHMSSIRRHFLHSDPQRISTVLMNVIRRSSAHRKLGMYIGKNCLGAIVLPDGNFICEDYPEQESPRQQMPHIVGPNASYRDIEIWTGQIPPWWKD